MAQAVATNFRRRILGSVYAGTNSMDHHSVHGSTVRIDRRMVEKIWKQMNRIVKYCQMPKLNLRNSPPYILDILPDLYQILKEIIVHYEEQLHVLNDIEYFRVFLDNLMELCTKTIECFKHAGQQICEEQSSYRKDLIKLSLYFSHNLTELKSLFRQGIYEGEKFRLTKEEAKEFWTNHFQQRTIVPWGEFREKLEQVHGGGLTNEETNNLQNTIDLTNNNHISIFEFDVFTRLFYPWSSLLTNWKLLAVTHPGFMAFLTYDEVKAILIKYIDKPGSYLFRLSCTRLGQWAIGYVTTQNTILQTIPQTKPLIQSLIDGEREGYYKYPIGRDIHIDLSSVLRPIKTNRINVSEEQFSLYSDMDTSFELCKICSVNNKNSKIQPCGHLLCQHCLIAWQNQNSAKPLSLCPFCRSEIKGFEAVLVKPFENPINLQTSTTIGHINNENLSTTPPPPIPPRPVNTKPTRLQSSVHLRRRFEEILLPPLHNNGIVLPVQQRPASISSNESLSDSNGSGDLYSESEIRTIDDLRNRLRSETNFEQTRIEAALILIEGLPLSKQYRMAKLFLNQVKYEQEQLLTDH